MLQAIGNEPLQHEFRNTLKPFYGVLKTMDGCIQFSCTRAVPPILIKPQQFPKAAMANLQQ